MAINVAPHARPKRRGLATVTNGDTLTEVGMERSGGGTKRGDPRSRGAFQRLPSRNTGHNPSVIAGRRHKIQDPVWQLGVDVEGLMKSARNAIHVLMSAERDWLVREEDGRELGHYPTRREAEAVGHKLARKRGVELVVDDGRGRVQRSRPRKGLFARLFGR
jgi:hypothetical protein